MFKVILSLVFFGLTAHASCPDLSGTFASQPQNAGDAEVILQVTQSEQQGVTTYDLAVTATENGQKYNFDLKFIADGQERVEEQADANGVYATSETFTCSEGQLNEAFYESYTDKKGQLLDKITGTGVFSITADGDLSYALEYSDLKGRTQKELSVYKRAN